MANAVCLIRTLPHYRHEAFTAGLLRLGYTVYGQPLKKINPDDLLVIWNRAGVGDFEARRHERAGSRVVVAENGYTDAVDASGHQWFSLSLGFHNGAGEWPVGDAWRWLEMGLELSPWRVQGSFVLVLPQRGMGPNGVAMPMSWPYSVRQRLARLTSRSVRVRPHPGLKSRAAPLAPALDGCHAVVTWASGAALKALQAGTPVFYDMPQWIGAGAAVPLEGGNLERPVMDDGLRLAMFCRLAWCQWRVEEITSGEAFAWLLQMREHAR